MSKRYKDAKRYAEKYKDILKPCKHCGSKDINIIKQYYRYNYKAVAVDEDGNKFYCNSHELDEICEKYNLEPAFEFVKTVEYKPYKPKEYNNFYQNNPRYIHRSVACKFPRLIFKKENDK